MEPFRSTVLPDDSTRRLHAIQLNSTLADSIQCDNSIHFKSPVRRVPHCPGACRQIESNGRTELSRRIQLKRKIESSSSVICIYIYIYYCLTFYYNLSFVGHTTKPSLFMEPFRFTVLLDDSIRRRNLIQLSATLEDSIQCGNSTQFASTPRAALPGARAVELNRMVELN